MVVFSFYIYQGTKWGFFVEKAKAESSVSSLMEWTNFNVLPT